MWDTAVHNSRVYTAGGQVADNITTGKAIKYMKERGVWNSLSEGWIANAGITADYLGATSKLFGLKALHDLDQTIGTLQPLYTGDGLSFDGTGKYLSKDISNTRVLELTDNGSYTQVFNLRMSQLGNGVSNPLFYIRYDANNAIYVKLIGKVNNSVSLLYHIFVNGVIKNTTSTPLVYDASVDNNYSIQYSPDGNVDFYVNSLHAIQMTGYPDIRNFVTGSTYKILLGFTSPGFNGIIKACAIYKGIISPELARIEV